MHEAALIHCTALSPENVLQSGIRTMNVNLLQFAKK